MRIFALVTFILGVPITSISLAQSPTSPDSTGGLVLTISSPKLTYVIGEPVKIDVVITNESQRTIWIRDIGCTVPYELEVRCPAGTRKKVPLCGVEASDCGTVPLRPGTGAYDMVHPMTANAELATGGNCPFVTVGAHRVRVVYSPYGGSASAVRSNELVVQIQLPTDIEQRILNSLAGANRMRGTNTWCMDYYNVQNVDTLRSLVSLYPEERATNYVRFALVEMLKTWPGHEEEILSLVEDIVTHDPEFWFEETRTILARWFRSANRWKEARPYLADAVRKRPLLMTNPDFAYEFILAMSEAPNDPRTLDEYRELRRQGTLRIESYLPPDSIR